MRSRARRRRRLTLHAHLRKSLPGPGFRRRRLPHSRCLPRVQLFAWSREVRRVDSDRAGLRGPVGRLRSGPAPVLRSRPGGRDGRSSSRLRTGGVRRAREAEQPDRRRELANQSHDISSRHRWKRRQSVAPRRAHAARGRCARQTGRSLRPRDRRRVPFREGRRRQDSLPPGPCRRPEQRLRRRCVHHAALLHGSLSATTEGAERDEVGPPTSPCD